MIIGWWTLLVNYGLFPLVTMDVDPMSSKERSLPVIVEKNGIHYPSYSEPDDSVFVVVDEMPLFKVDYTLKNIKKQKDYSNRMLIEYIQENMKYPKGWGDICLQGFIAVSFVIDEKGKVSNPEIRKSLHPALDTIVLKIIMDMPPWEKAPKHRGKPVKVKYTIPVHIN